MSGLAVVKAEVPTASLLPLLRRQAGASHLHGFSSVRRLSAAGDVRRRADGRRSALC